MTESEKVFEEWFEDIYQKDALSLEAGKPYEGLISKDLAWSAWEAGIFWASEKGFACELLSNSFTNCVGRHKEGEDNDRIRADV